MNVSTVPVRMEAHVSTPQDPTTAVVKQAGLAPTVLRVIIN